ncbi:lytic murein transglycosylase [Lysobacter antibioticus]|uniref:lytic murein transglycosylase n=1 Tax=Lysobacter antibioticus TaxID=84531 RepID=UPI0007165EF6
MPRLLRSAVFLSVFAASAFAQAAPRQEPEILTEDVTRFYALYDATGGRPTVEQIDKDYLAKGTHSLSEFARLRRVTAQSIAKRLDSDPAMYAKAKDCLVKLPEVKRRVATALGKLATLYPEARFPPVAVVVGRGRPVGIADNGGLTIGLEALCSADFMNPDAEDRFVHVIAHEYAHIQQTGPTEFEPGDPNGTALRFALLEGGAEFVAELISGNVGNGRHAEWTRGKEAEIESAFVRIMDGTDLSAWFANYRNPDEPYDLGYWVGYRIAKAYYLGSKDRKAALKKLIEFDDPKALLAQSGWTPGMRLPAKVSGEE